MLYSLFTYRFVLNYFSCHLSLTKKYKHNLDDEKIIISSLCIFYTLFNPHNIPLYN